MDKNTSPSQSSCDDISNQDTYSFMLNLNYSDEELLNYQQEQLVSLHELPTPEPFSFLSLLTSDGAGFPSRTTTQESGSESTQDGRGIDFNPSVPMIHHHFHPSRPPAVHTPDGDGFSSSPSTPTDSSRCSRENTNQSPLNQSSFRRGWVWHRQSEYELTRRGSQQQDEPNQQEDSVAQRRLVESREVRKKKNRPYDNLMTVLTPIKKSKPS